MTRTIPLLPASTDPTVVIRRVRPEEYEAVGRLRLDAYRHDYEIGDDYAEQMLDVAAHENVAEVWVAADASSGELLATVTTARDGSNFTPLGRPGELDWRLLAVDPEARGRGLGRLLTVFVIDLARARGVDRVVMNSGSDMYAAHHLYDTLGFVRLPTRENPPGIEPSRAYGLDL